LADNLPCTVHECVQSGIPFVASDVGGIPEIVDPAAHDRALLPLDVPRFTERLRDVIATGQSPAGARVADRENVARWLAWHENIGLHPNVVAREGADGMAAPREEPTVSICMAHHERPELLGLMLESLRAQTSTPLELVLVDDGSRSAAARHALESLERDFEARGWTLIRQENTGPGAARHAAAEAARGEYLLFVDDDDWAEPNALETFTRVAAHTGADVLVSAYRGFEGAGRPRPDTPVKRWHLPLGAALAAGLIYPELGGTMIFVHRQAYFDCGGFPTERDVDEDWELLLRLVAAGNKLEVVPEPLFWYREAGDGRSRTDNRFLRTQSRIRLLESMLPIELRDLVQPAFAQLAGAGDAAGLRRTDRVREALERAAARKAKG
jgi:GT2 family glycosyltransferase